MRNHDQLQPATRADWAALAKANVAMDLAIAVIALVIFALGGHA